MNKNDIAWAKLFSKYRILNSIQNNGFFTITASQIKEFREPRLMTKLDHKLNLPNIFINNKLSILPISRGEYIISTFDTYNKFTNLSDNFQYISIPSHIQTLIPKFIINESIALNCAYACGILHDFIGDDELISTVNGRMSSGKFNFKIYTSFKELDIQVDNSQIEIDAAYEGIESLSLCEAKMDISEDFIIRQLYYPYRTWSNRITKPINTIFMIFSNGTFNLYNYKFKDINNYNSIELIDQKNYIISTHITLEDIEYIVNNTSIVNEPEIPFPQADRMDRIINLIELLNDKPMNKNDITYKYEFDERQTNYYTDAGRYLDLIDKYRDIDGIIYFRLTDFGNHIMKLSYKDRQLSIIRAILSHRVFNKVLKIHLNTGNMPTKDKIISIMKDSNILNIDSESTYYRRTSTISGWINWILDRVEIT